MLRKTAVLALALCFALQGAAQEGVYINGSDTLHYSYTPLPEQPQPQKRLSFPRRVVKYFEGSTRDRTFEKKIDFTFAGGPSYSKNTESRHRTAGGRTLPHRPYGLGHFAVGHFDLRQRLDFGILCAGRHGQQHLLPQRQAHRLYGDVRFGTPRHVGHRL